MPERTKPDLIRDPKRLRALAHPLRWELIELLTGEGEATATRCAEVLGQSVASCSYHLNLLAKYGFVEHVPGADGREKPWRLAIMNQSFSTEGLDRETTLAAEAAGDAFLEHEITAFRQRMRRKNLEPPEWRDATGINAGTTFVTRAELAELRDEIAALIDRYEHRLRDAAARPEGAREVRLFLATSVVPRRPMRGDTNEGEPNGTVA